MNQKLKELSDLALKSVSAEGTGSFTREYIEKLYELTIRECAKIVFEKTGSKSALNVLDHFGVEE